MKVDDEMDEYIVHSLQVFNVCGVSPNPFSRSLGAFSINCILCFLWYCCTMLNTFQLLFHWILLEKKPWKDYVHPSVLKLYKPVLSTILSTIYVENKISKNVYSSRYNVHVLTIHVNFHGQNINIMSCAKKSDLMLQKLLCRSPS